MPMARARTILITSIDDAEDDNNDDVYHSMTAQLAHGSGRVRSEGSAGVTLFFFHSDLPTAMKVLSGFGPTPCKSRATTPRSHQSRQRLGCCQKPLVANHSILAQLGPQLHPDYIGRTQRIAAACLCGLHLALPFFSAAHQPCVHRRQGLMRPLLHLLKQGRGCGVRGRRGRPVTLKGTWLWSLKATGSGVRLAVNTALVQVR
jgi:hypothetical protein